MRWLLVIVLALLPLVFGGDAAAGNPGSVSGTVFADADSDGVLDPDEVPLEGVSVSITGENQGCPDYCASKTTGHGGSFAAELPAASYHARVLSGYECMSPYRANWLGEYIQGFCTNGGVDVPFVVEAGEETNVLVPIDGLKGRLGGRLWLDGLPARHGTLIEARRGDTVCAAHTASTRELTSGVLVSEFYLTFGVTCVDGPITLFADGRVFASTTGAEVWSRSVTSWRFNSTYFSDREYATPGIRPFFASLPGNYDLTSLRAIIGGVTCGAASGTTNVYGLAILPEEVRPGCGVLNSEILFCMGGRLASPDSFWHTGEDYFPPILTKTDNACPVPVVMGDGNCDGLVNALDIADALRATSGVRRLACAGEANTNCDFALQTHDVVPVLGYLAGIETQVVEDCPAVGDAMP